MLLKESSSLEFSLLCLLLIFSAAFTRCSLCLFRCIFMRWIILQWNTSDLLTLASSRINAFCNLRQLNFAKMRGYLAEGTSIVFQSI
jgi:hypothetical protein